MRVEGGELRVEGSGVRGQGSPHPSAIRTAQNCISTATSRRVPASFSTNQGPDEGDLFPFWGLVDALVYKTSMPTCTQTCLRK